MFAFTILLFIVITISTPLKLSRFQVFRKKIQRFSSPVYVNQYCSQSFLSKNQSTRVNKVSEELFFTYISTRLCLNYLTIHQSKLIQTINGLIRFCLGLRRKKCTLFFSPPLFVHQCVRLLLLICLSNILYYYRGLKSRKHTLHTSHLQRKNHHSFEIV